MRTRRIADLEVGARYADMDWVAGESPAQRTAT
jgi:hypothetical protein